MECRSLSCLAFIRDAFIIFHQQFLGTKAYTHSCSPSAIVPFATLRDIDQPFLPQLGFSNRVDLCVTGNSSQTGLIVSNLWPYTMRAARGSWAEVRNFTGWCEAILFLSCSVGWNPWKPLGSQCQWHPVQLTLFYSGIPLRHSGVSGLPGRAPCFLTFIDCFWCLEVCWRAWTWVSGSLYSAKSSFHMVVLPVCRSLAAARDWQTPRFDEMLMSKTEKTIERHAESPEDICFFGFFWGKQQQQQILGPWYHWDLGHIGGLCQDQRSWEIQMGVRSDARKHHPFCRKHLQRDPSAGSDARHAEVTPCLAEKGGVERGFPRIGSCEHSM